MSTPYTVVYIEDNPANFALVKRLLEATGRYRVIGSEGGSAGIRLVKDTDPAVVLLDLDLPDMSGLEVARALREDEATRALPVLAITASVMKRERAEALAAGCDRFIEKPFDIDGLRRHVAEAVELGRKCAEPLPSVGPGDDD